MRVSVFLQFIVAAGLALAPAVAAAGELYAHSDLTLHAGPGEQFGGAGALDRGARITVLWCNASADWCLVRHAADEGWVPMAAIRGPGTSAREAASSDGSAAVTGASGAGKVSGSPSPTTAPAAAGVSATVNAGGASLSVGGGGVGVSVPGAGLDVKLP
jgi:uncharacterized protein YraI